MFDHSLVQSDLHPIGSHRLITLPLTILVHASMIAALIAVQVFVVDFPEQSPAQAESFLVVADPPSAPPPPPPPAGRPAATPAPPRQVAARSVESAPSSIPENIPDLAPAEGTPGSSDGSADGVEGGEAGGVPGGIPGGVVQQQPSPLQVGGDVLAPVAISSPAPEYPAEALKQKLEGLVRMELVVGADGAVKRARLVQSTNPIFEKPALEGVMAWQFNPGTLHGEPVETVFRMAIAFQIPGSKQKKSGWWRR